MSTGQVPKAAHFDIEVDGRPIGRINFLLYPNTPRTSANFGGMCEGHTPRHPVSNRAKTQIFKMLSYRDTVFHRCIPGFMLQGGSVLEGKVNPSTGQLYPGSYPGTDSVSVYGDRFPDENFLNKHEVGCLSMANSGPNSNGSQFYITTAATGHLDNKHVVFGRVADTESMRVAKKMESFGSRSGTTSGVIKISDCGVDAWWDDRDISNARGKSYNSRTPI